MLELGIRTNIVIVTGLLLACGSAISIRRGREIRGLIYRMGIQMNVYIASALVDMYSKCGSVKVASNVFQAVTVMIGCFGKHNMVESALHLFEKMKQEGIAIPTCGSVISIRRGREIHGLIYRMEIQMNVYVASAVVDMYSKCGSVKGASRVFQAVTVKNVASWNAMIGCFGKHNMVESALHLFEKMTQEGIAPNEVTLVSVLSAFSHSGLVDKGLEIFRSMNDADDVLVLKENYACVVDLLCRAGRMDEAPYLLKAMSTDVTESMLGAFFNGV